MSDARLMLIDIAKEHLKYKPVQDITRWLVSDQSSSFLTQNFAPKGLWCGTGGLVDATLNGYKPLRMLCKTSEVIYSTPNIDRIVAIYLILMISRNIEVPSGRITFQDGLGSVGTTAVINALSFGMCDMTPGEVQALTKWWASRTEMIRDHEPFNHEWWIIAETLNWIFTANKKG